jgi:hypothetical protein
MIVDSLLVDFEGIESARKDSSEEGRVQLSGHYHQ